VRLSYYESFADTVIASRCRKVYRKVVAMYVNRCRISVTFLLLFVGTLAFAQGTLIERSLEELEA